MLVGYARVSMQDQDLGLQRDALEAAGCEKVFVDHVSGAKAERPGLSRTMDALRKGDTLVIWRLDRLGRSLKDLIALVGKLEENNIGLKSITESIDTTTTGGKLVFHMFGAIAEFERNLIRERTLAGLAASRAKGIKAGRKKILDPRRRELAVKLYKDKIHSASHICRIMGISRMTLYRYVKDEEAVSGKNG